MHGCTTSMLCTVTWKAQCYSFFWSTKKLLLMKNNNHPWQSCKIKELKMSGFGQLVVQKEPPQSTSLTINSIKTFVCRPWNILSSATRWNDVIDDVSDVQLKYYTIPPSFVFRIPSHNKLNNSNYKYKIANFNSKEKEWEIIQITNYYFLMHNNF